jgi:Uma2 family endonuclease
LLLDETQVEIPSGLGSLSEFRRWALSDDFPERGRIDYATGRIEVDMSPEDVFCHGLLKTEIVGVLQQIVKRESVGYLFTDRTRVSSVAGDVSSEPDEVFISHEALETGRVRLIEKATGEPGRYIELEGAADLIVEIVSDSSVEKDTRRLPDAYFKAGVREFWLADARREPLFFRIQSPGRSGYDAAESDTEGFQRSTVLGRWFRLDGKRVKRRWSFDLRSK